METARLDDSADPAQGLDRLVAEAATLGPQARRAAEAARQQAQAADRRIREHPYVAIGAAAALGLLVGALIARR